MAGRGLPPLGRGRTGDLRVVVNVVIPRRLLAQAARPARSVLGLADRGQPARERGHDREAQTGPRRVIRLGLRVRARGRGGRVRAPGAAARRRVRGGRARRSRRVRDLRRATFRRPVVPGARLGRRARRSTTAGRPPGTSTWSRSRSARSTIRPPWLPGRRARRRPGVTFGLAAHPTTRLCLALLQELPPTRAGRLGLRLRRALASPRAHLGFDPVTAIELDPGAVATARANGVDAHVGDVTDGPAVGADGRREPHGAADSSWPRARRPRAAGHAARLRASRRCTPTSRRPPGSRSASSSASGACSTAGPRASWSTRDPARDPRRSARTPSSCSPT